MGLGLGLANSPNWVRVMISSLTKLRKVRVDPRFTNVGSMLNLPAWGKGQRADCDPDMLIATHPHHKIIQNT